ncbi:MAG: hypothetical protein IJX38_01230 [Clostridia bacterium]|nr:hypothetical protein [Clostridia bacterium]
MARGQKYGDDVRERAYALLATNGNVRAVAKELGLPYTTVRTWRNTWMREENDTSDSENDTIGASDFGESELAKLRTKKRTEFAANAWSFIEKASRLLGRRLERAVEEEARLDKILDVCADLELTQAQKRELYSKISMLKLESTKELTTIIGTLYDKQALANREATNIIDGSMVVKKFEDY